MQQVADVNSPRFGEQFHRDLQNPGFSSVTGVDQELLEARDRLYTLSGEFFALPQDEKMKHFIPNCGGQRGYTPDGIENSGVGKGEELVVRELREHLAFGPALPKGHPLRRYADQSGGMFYSDNSELAVVPGLRQAGEDFQRRIENLALDNFTALARHLGLKDPFFWARRFALGTSLERIHYYPAIPKDHIVEERVMNRVQLRNGEILEVEDFPVLDILGPDGTVIKNVVRTGFHTDVDHVAYLCGSHQAGLNILTREGKTFPFTSAANAVVANGGDYLEVDAQYVREEMASQLSPEVLAAGGPDYQSMYHWVGLDRNMAQRPRSSIVQFIHPRAMARVGRNHTDADLLITRLSEIGYFTPELRDSLLDMAEGMTPDDAVVSEILQWERDNPSQEQRIGRFYHLVNARTGTFEAKYE